MELKPPFMRILLFALLVTVCHSSFAADKNETGRTLTTAIGNKIEFTRPVAGTVPVENATTGKIELKTFNKIPEKPCKLNGRELVSGVINNPLLNEAQQKICK